MKKLLCAILVCVVVLLAGCSKKTDTETVTYGGKTYCLMEYKPGVFYYDLAVGGEYEPDKIYPMAHEKWDILYCSGDLFAREDQIGEVNRYYGDDDNYTWWVRVENADLEELYTAQLTPDASELAFFDTVESMDRKDTMHFAQIEKFATFGKTSKDGFLTGRTELAWFQNGWYWRSEVIDDQTEGWPEYVFPLPRTLSDRITRGGTN